MSDKEDKSGNENNNQEKEQVSSISKDSLLSGILSGISNDSDMQNDNSSKSSSIISQKNQNQEKNTNESNEEVEIKFSQLIPTALKVNSTTEEKNDDLTATENIAQNLTESQIVENNSEIQKDSKVESNSSQVSDDVKEKDSFTESKISSKTSEDFSKISSEQISNIELNESSKLSSVSSSDKISEHESDKKQKHEDTKDEEKKDSAPKEEQKEQKEDFKQEKVSERETEQPKKIERKDSQYDNVPKISIPEKDPHHSGKESQRKKEQDESSARLSQPRHKYLPANPEEIAKLPIVSPPSSGKRRSYREQQEASARLSMPKQRVTNILPTEQQAKSSRRPVSPHDCGEHYMSSSRRMRNVPPYQQSNEIQKAPPEFVKMFGIQSVKDEKKQKKEAAKTFLQFKHPEKNSTLTAEQISSLADGILSGKRKCTDDPATIADVINELTNRRIKAMRECDYLEALKLKETADKVRTNFRIHDRENFYKDYISDIKSKLQEAKSNLKEVEQVWKERMKSFKNSCKEEVQFVESKQNGEMDDFEDYWQSDSAARKFSKKSPVLLSQLTMEKNMALTGDLLGAHKMQKSIRRHEAIEAQERALQMKQTCQIEQKNLINKQDIEMEHLSMAHELARKTIEKQAADEIGVAQKRVDALERMLQEESDLDKFCAKKFKKDSKHLVPMCVTINGGDDIPTSGATRAAPRNTSILMDYREAAVSTHLQLPKLKIKRPKSSTARREAAEKSTRKKTNDF